MTKSALQIARAAYQPKLPKALASGAVKAVAKHLKPAMPLLKVQPKLIRSSMFVLCRKDRLKS